MTWQNLRRDLHTELSNYAWPRHWPVGTAIRKPREWQLGFNLHTPQAANEARRKLSDDDVRAIRSSSQPQRALAKQYGVSTTTIVRVRKGVRREKQRKQ